MFFKVCRCDLSYIVACLIVQLRGRPVKALELYQVLLARILTYGVRQ
jgi:hypothetical protein